MEELVHPSRRLEYRLWATIQARRAVAFLGASTHPSLRFLFLSTQIHYGEHEGHSIWVPQWPNWHLEPWGSTDALPILNLTLAPFCWVSYVWVIDPVHYLLRVWKFCSHSSLVDASSRDGMTACRVRCAICIRQVFNFDRCLDVIRTGLWLVTEYVICRAHRHLSIICPLLCYSEILWQNI